jgi:hypothetical protein
MITHDVMNGERYTSGPLNEAGVVAVLQASVLDHAAEGK